mmetsp:Transcript_58212/g.156591  ORF Transcript_58212/g.156591 Transcript_58212/m.156591 type:complete len:244 (-) Transcript_58212:10-741(-)
MSPSLHSTVDADQVQMVADSSFAKSPPRAYPKFEALAPNNMSPAGTGTPLDVLPRRLDGAAFVSGSSTTASDANEDPPEYLSRGGKNHRAGMCRPCSRLFSSGGCRDGQMCNFCHYPHDDNKMLEAASYSADKSMRRALGTKRPRPRRILREGGTQHRNYTSDRTVGPSPKEPQFVVGGHGADCVAFGAEACQPMSYFGDAHAPPPWAAASLRTTDWAALPRPLQFASCIAVHPESGCLILSV